MFTVKAIRNADQKIVTLARKVNEYDATYVAAQSWRTGRYDRIQAWHIPSNSVVATWA